MYAIIDIETTGGRPDVDKITEIAIILHNGACEVGRFVSLVNPECNIPYHISQLTGITNDMVLSAPKFYEIAKKVLEMTQNAVFVAHNVRFDYSFVKAAYKNLGFNYNLPTLCTVRLSRKAFPGFPSYSLGKLCDNLGVAIENRHRALGDAEATSIVFAKIFSEKNELFTANALSEAKKISTLPPLLDKAVYDSIPEGKTGVYYFYNSDGEVIYIGKCLDVKKRISQHFSLSAKGSKKSMALKAEIADITFTETGSELIALLLESDEIKKIRPKYNVSQKKIRAVPFFGVFANYDFEGYVNLTIQKLKEGDEPLTTSDSVLKAKDFLYRQIDKHQLCLAKCDLHKTGGPCFNWHIKKCKGACCGNESADDYNIRTRNAIEAFSFKNESFMIVTKGREAAELAVVCVENGQYKGFGYIDTIFGTPSVTDMRECIKKYPHNRDIQNILCGFLKTPHQKISYQL